MIRNYAQFFWAHPRKMLFCASHCFGSSLGQTFLIAVFVPFLLQDFELSAAAFGAIYGIATIASAFTVPFLGRLVDHYDLRYVSTAVYVFLSLGAMVVAFASNSFMLGLGIYMLRLGGQGLLSKIGPVAAGRFFIQNRGKALSLTGLGWPLGEAFYPAMAAFAIHLIGWQSTLLSFAAMGVFFLLPLALFLGMKDSEFTNPHEAAAKIERDYGDSIVQMTQREFLHSPYFYMVVPYCMISPFLVTALFFFQSAIADWKGWPITTFAAFMSVYGIVRLIVGLISGELVDRFTARRLLPFTELFTVCALVMLIFATSLAHAALYLAILGVGVGLNSNIKGALWAEIYGTKHLGAIRSITESVMIIATGLSPALTGYLLDRNVSITTMLCGMIIYILLAALMVYFAPLPPHARLRTRKNGFVLTRM